MGSAGLPKAELRALGALLWLSGAAPGSLQELLILFGEQGALAGIPPGCCWPECLGRRRSHQKRCHRGFGSALMLQHRDRTGMHTRRATRTLGRLVEGKGRTCLG